MVPHSVGGRRAHPSLSFPRAHSCAPRPRSSCLGGSARGGPPLCPASEPALERAPHTPKPPAVNPGRHAGEPGWGPAGLGRGLVETAGGGGCQSPCPSPTLGSWPIGQSLAPGWGGSVGSRAEAGHGWSPLDKGGRIFLPDHSPLRGVQGKALAVLPVAPAPEPGRLCQESPVCQQGVQVETGTGLGTLLMHTSCRGREGTWGARECSQPGPQRGAGLPRAFVASPGDCTSFSEWTVLGTGPDALVTGRGPQDLLCAFWGRRAQHWVPGGHPESSSCSAHWDWVQGLPLWQQARPSLGELERHLFVPPSQPGARHSPRLNLFAHCEMRSVISASTGPCL